MMLDVYMHQPYTPARSFIDALQAFWPGLQVSTKKLQIIMFYFHVLSKSK